MDARNHQRALKLPAPDGHLKALCLGSDGDRLIPGAVDVWHHPGAAERRGTSHG
jgi:hypothetical protein